MWTGLLVNVLVVCELSNKILVQADPYTEKKEKPHPYTGGMLDLPVRNWA